MTMEKFDINEEATKYNSLFKLCEDLQNAAKERYEEATEEEQCLLRYDLYCLFENEYEDLCKLIIQHLNLENLSNMRLLECTLDSQVPDDSYGEWTLYGYIVTESYIAELNERLKGCGFLK